MIWCKVVLNCPGGIAENLYEKLPGSTSSHDVAKKMIEAKYPGCKVHAFVGFATGEKPPSFWPK